MGVCVGVCVRVCVCVGVMKFQLTSDYKGYQRLMLWLGSLPREFLSVPFSISSWPDPNIQPFADSLLQLVMVLVQGEAMKQSK